MPSSCSFSSCIASKELSERNNEPFKCKHVQELLENGGIEPEAKLLVEDSR
jgi:hypothetical protein